MGAMASRDPSGYLLIGALFGLYMYGVGLGNYTLRKRIEYTPTSKAIAVAPGLAEVAGEVRALVSPVVSPYAQVPCAYYVCRVFRWSGSGKRRRKHLHRKLESPDPLCVEDDTGRVEVRPDPEAGLADKSLIARILPKGQVGYFLDVDVKRSWGGKGLLGSAPLEPAMEAFLRANAPDLLDYRDRIEVEETYIREGDPLYVLGPAKSVEGPGGSARMLIQNDAEVFCVADGQEKNALARLSWQTWLMLLGGPLVFGGAGGILALHLFRGAWWAMAPVAMGTGAMYAYLVVVVVLQMYNGLVVLRANIDRARANTDALLQRRRELIPRLAEVVRGYAEHERGMQQSVAAMRAGTMDVGAREWVALAEGYPALGADANFRSFQKELERTEEWIAASRGFINDSIQLFNAKIQSFPYLLFAPAMGLTPMAHESYAAAHGEPAEAAPDPPSSS